MELIVEEVVFANHTSFEVSIGLLRAVVRQAGMFYMPNLDSKEPRPPAPLHEKVWVWSIWDEAGEQPREVAFSTPCDVHLEFVEALSNAVFQLAAYRSMSNN